MERLTERIKRPQKDDLIVYTNGKYEDTIPAEMTNDDIRAVLKKLADYEDLEEQGLLVRLPCKVGDSVFIIVGKDVSKQKIIKVEISDNGIIFKTNRQKRIFSIAGLGENVFLTLEEAEKKLEEMQNAKNA